MTSPVNENILVYEPRPRPRPDQTALERERLRKLVITSFFGFVLVVLIACSFGG